MRSTQLNELRDRMHSAFNYTQKVRNKDIKYNNKILATKCLSGRSSLSASGKSLEKERVKSNRSIDGNTSLERIDGEVSRKFVLRNHRNSPVNKMTKFDRTK